MSNGNNHIWLAYNDSSQYGDKRTIHSLYCVWFNIGLCQNHCVNNNHPLFEWVKCETYKNKQEQLTVKLTHNRLFALVM